MRTKKRSIQEIIRLQKRSFKQGLRNRIKSNELDRKSLLKHFFICRADISKQLNPQIENYHLIYHFQAYNYLVLQANHFAFEDGNEIDDHLSYLEQIAFDWARLRHNEVKLKRGIVRPMHPTFPSTQETLEKIKEMGFAGNGAYKLQYIPDEKIIEPVRDLLIELKTEIIGSYYFTSIPEIARMIDFISQNMSDSPRSIEQINNYFSDYSEPILIITEDEYQQHMEIIGFDFIQDIGQSSPAPIGFRVGDIIIIDLEMIRLIHRFAQYNTKECKKERANYFEHIIRKIGTIAGWEVEDFKVEFPRLPEDMENADNPNVTEVDIVLQYRDKHLLIESKNWGIWSFHFLGIEDTSRYEMLKKSAEKMAFRRKLYADLKQINKKDIDLLIISSIHEQWPELLGIPIISVNNLFDYLVEKRKKHD